VVEKQGVKNTLLSTSLLIYYAMSRATLILSR
jgi:hypothetical protein